MQIASRSFGGLADLERMIDFLAAASNSGEAHGYAHIGDLIWRLYQNTSYDPPRMVRLWEGPGEELLGFAWHEEHDGVFMQVHPRLRGSGLLEGPMAEWGASLIDRSLPTYDGHLWTRCEDADAATLAALAALGFQRDDGFHTVRLVRGLGDPIGPGPLPAGFSVRQVGGEDEWAARVELHREVWHPSRVTLDAYRRLREAPVYRPDLDLVAVAPDGRQAAYAICWLDEHSRTGEFEPVGASASFRGQGLAKAVVLEGLRRLQALGARTVFVTSVGGNIAAQRLYESAGFSTQTIERIYGRPLDN